MLHEFEQWIALSTFNTSHLRNHGDFPAVYVLRDKTTDDVLKFGHTGHMRRRIVANYLGGVGGPTTQRIHAELFTNIWIDRVEISWIEMESKAAAEIKEKALRAMYKNTHRRLPPWDRQS